MVETGAPAFYAVEVVVDFVCPIEGNVDEGVRGEGVEFKVFETSFEDDLFASQNLLAKGYMYVKLGLWFTCRD